MATPDTLSPLWPERPIRPLPKNRLRSKLSPEQADSIVFPPNPPSSSPLFSFPYGLADVHDGHEDGRVNGQRHASPTHCTCGGEHEDSEEEEVVYDHPSYRWSSPTADGARLDNVQRRLLEASRVPLKAPPAPASIASSADGYESFENTSNKKKRKIPLSSSSSVHASSLSAELAHMGISSSGTDRVNGPVNGDSALHANGHMPSGGTGISGAGRGRYGRQVVKGERRPVGLTNGYASSLSARSRGGNWKGDGTKTENEVNGDGIISTAIANAAEQEPSTPQRGNDNVSLLSPSVNSQTPTTKFTFTCESDSSNKMVWPGQGGGSPYTPTSQQNATYPARGVPGAASQAMAAQTHQSTQTTPSLRGGGPPLGSATAPLPATQHPPVDHAAPPPARPRRRRPSKEYAAAARDRRMRQEYENYNHKPNKDSMWICEFCEYEDIFGEPPRALIRSYEIKDRAERKKADERRRLLEKAKMKNRKGKKGNKNNGNGYGGKNAAAPQGQPNVPGEMRGGYDDQDPGLDNMPLPPEGQTEYYEDEHDYDPVTPNEHDHVHGGCGCSHGHQHTHHHHGGQAETRVRARSTASAPAA